MLTETIAELISEGSLREQTNMIEIFNLMAELNNPGIPTIETLGSIRFEPIYKDGYLSNEGVNIVYENSVWYKMIRSKEGILLQAEDGVEIHDKVINVERIAK